MAEKIIENIVVTTELSLQLPLQSLAVSIQNAEYQDEDPVLIIRFGHPKRAVFLTKQGKLTCTGVHSMKEGEQTVSEAVEILRSHAVPISEIPEVHLQSFVISVQHAHSQTLDEVRTRLPVDQLIYQPQKNPWVEYLYNEHLTFLIHESGTMVCTGAGSIDDAHQAIDELIQVLE